MVEVRFYHLVRTTLERALPELLEKCVDRGWRAVVMAGSEERVEQLAHLLWTYHDRSFLPHGTRRDGEPDRQPIWLTDEDENPNGAKVLFAVDGAVSAHPDRFERICDLFDGNDPEALEAARGRWRAMKAAGHTLVYWQQDEAGRWREKQRTGPAAEA